MLDIGGQQRAGAEQTDIVLPIVRPRDLVDQVSGVRVLPPVDLAVQRADAENGSDVIHSTRSRCAPSARR